MVMIRRFMTKNVPGVLIVSIELKWFISKSTYIVVFVLKDFSLTI